jgi:hypothetical protein
MCAGIILDRGRGRVVRKGADVGRFLIAGEAALCEKARISNAS